MNETSSFLLVSVGAPFLIGASVGYFTKKALKLALLIMGFSVIVLFVASHYGVVEVSNADLVSGVEEGTGVVNQFGQFLVDNLSGISGVGLGSSVAGFLAGLKYG